MNVCNLSLINFHILNKDVYFWTIYYHTKFQDPTLSSAPTLKRREFTKLLLLVTGN